LTKWKLKLEGEEIPQKYGRFKEGFRLLWNDFPKNCSQREKDLVYATFIFIYVIWFLQVLIVVLLGGFS